MSESEPLTMFDVIQAQQNNFPTRVERFITRAILSIPVSFFSPLNQDEEIGKLLNDDEFCKDTDPEIIRAARIWHMRLMAGEFREDKYDDDNDE